jgi:hypothetical protein
MRSQFEYSRNQCNGALTYRLRDAIPRGRSVHVPWRCLPRPERRPSFRWRYDLGDLLRVPPGRPEAASGSLHPEGASTDR